MFPGMSTPLLILGMVQLTKLYFYGVHIVVAVLYEATNFETMSIFLLLIHFLGWFPVSYLIKCNHTS